MAAIPVNFVILFAFFAFILYLLGLHNVLTGIDKNSCEMTYMFEFPQYVEISLPPDIQRRYPRYSLYGYSEGGATENLRRMKFSGIPVLFLPGNSGSHRQGRSLASVALRRAFSSRSPFHFNFFLADFGEDLSGIYGGVLSGETEFVRISIEKILSLYKKDGPYVPDSVVLIGHSAGGIVAKNVFASPDFDHRLVKLIITLATPHQTPVLHADPFLTDIYGEVAKIWHPRSPNVSHVTLVSLGGGNRDVVVRSDVTRDLSADVNILTTGIPGVWCSMDHLSITWCKQLILTLARTLFDSVDPRTKQITDDSDHRLQVFKYHLLKRSAGKKYVPFSARSSFERSVKWIENLQRQFSVIEKRGLKSPQFVMLRLLDDVKHAAAVVEAINVNVKDWVYVCVADAFEDDFRICEEGMNLSNETEILPAHWSRRKLIKLDMLQLKSKGFSHVLVRFPPLSTPMSINVDVFNPADRTIEHPVPRIWSLTNDVVVDNTVDNAVHYTVNLPGFDQVWQAFHLTVQGLTCKTSHSHTSVTFSVPWANESQPFYFLDNETFSVSLKLFSARPPKFNKTTSPSLRFVLDPSCKYRIALGPDKLAAAGQLARYYSHLLPGYIAAVLLLTLRRQLESLEEGAGIPLFHNALTQSCRKYYLIVQTTIIGSRIFGMKLVASLFPTPDPVLLQDLGLDFFLLPIFLFLNAAAISYIAGAVVYAAVVVSGQAAHKLAFRFLARTITGVVSWSEWIFSALHQLPFAAATLLVSISWSTVGGLGMVLAAAFYFLTLCKLYEDYLEDLLKISLKFAARTIKHAFIGKSSNAATAAASSAPEELKEKDDEEKCDSSNEDGGGEKEGNTADGVEDAAKDKDVYSGGKGKEVAGEEEKDVYSGEDEEVTGEEEKDVDSGEKEEEVAGEEEKDAYSGEDEEEVTGEEEKDVDFSVVKGRVEGALEIFEISGGGGPPIVVANPEIPEPSTLEMIHFHVTICLLYLLAAVTVVPSILAWSRSFHESTQLYPDSTWIPGFVLPSAGCILWQGGVPTSNRKLSVASTSILYALAAASIMFGSVSLYRLSFFIAITAIYLVVHQIHARWFCV